MEYQSENNRKRKTKRSFRSCNSIVKLWIIEDNGLYMMERTKFVVIFVRSSNWNVSFYLDFLCKW